MAADVDAAIREWLTPVPTVNEWGEWMRRTRAALLAVLDLHKPVVGEEESSSGLLLCAECGPGEDEHYKPLWPCETVRAVAKALGVEAAGAP